MNLSNQTILLTGAANGIGRNLATRLLFLKNPPAKLILWDIEYENLVEFKDYYSKYFIGSKEKVTKIYCQKVDLSKLENLDHNLLCKYSDGIIDVFLPIAGYAERNLTSHQSIQDFQKSINVNFLSIVKLTKLILEGRSSEVTRTMPKHIKTTSYECQNIVFISSFLSTVGLPYFSSYSSAKASLSLFAQSLGSELFLAKKYAKYGQYYEKEVQCSMLESPKQKYDRIEEFKSYTSLPNISTVLPQAVKTRFINDSPCNSAIYNFSKLSSNKVTEQILTNLTYHESIYCYSQVFVGWIAWFYGFFGRFLSYQSVYEMNGSIGLLQAGKKQSRKEIS